MPKELCLALLLWIGTSGFAQVLNYRGRGPGSETAQSLNHAGIQVRNINGEHFWKMPHPSVIDYLLLEANLDAELVKFDRLDRDLLFTYCQRYGARKTQTRYPRIPKGKIERLFALIKAQEG